MDANAEQKFLERFFQFIDSEGGFYKVGEDVGVKAQTFYAMQSRKSIPNSATLLKMVEKYNGLDLNILFRGKPSEKEAELQKEIEELRRKNEELSRTHHAMLTLVEKQGKIKGATVMPDFNLFRKKNPRFILWNQGISKRKGL
jgi:DNA-binding phage protein